MKSVSTSHRSHSSQRARRRFYVYTFTVVAAAGVALVAACSSSDSGGTSSGSTPDASSDGKGSSGTSGAVTGDTGTVGAQDKDTCKGAAPGNSCQCSCAITGQKEDKTLHCLQPMQDTGECPKLCCTGDVDASGIGMPIPDASDDGG